MRDLNIFGSSEAPSKAIPYSGPFRQDIDEASKLLGIDPRLAHGLAKTESDYDPLAISPAGALGIMQLMEGTADDLGVDRTNPKENIYGGLQYLKNQMDRFDDTDKALAAFNWGPGNISKAIEAYGDKWGEHIPDETKKHLERSKRYMEAKVSEPESSVERKHGLRVIKFGPFEETQKASEKKEAWPILKKWASGLPEEFGKSILDTIGIARKQDGYEGSWEEVPTWAEKESILDVYKAGTSLVGGAATFIPSVATGLGQLAFQIPRLAGDITLKDWSKRTMKMINDSLALINTPLEPIQAMQTPGSRAAAEPVEKVFETFLWPAHKTRSFLEEKGYPVLGYAIGTIMELGEFALAHRILKGKKSGKILDDVKSVDDVNAVVDIGGENAVRLLNKALDESDKAGTDRRGPQYDAIRAAEQARVNSQSKSHTERQRAIKRALDEKTREVKGKIKEPKWYPLKSGVSATQFMEQVKKKLAPKEVSDAKKITQDVGEISPEKRVERKAEGPIRLRDIEKDRMGSETREIKSIAREGIKAKGIWTLDAYKLGSKIYKEGRDRSVLEKAEKEMDAETSAIIKESRNFEPDSKEFNNLLDKASYNASAKQYISEALEAFDAVSGKDIPKAKAILKDLGEEVVGEKAEMKLEPPPKEGYVASIKGPDGTLYNGVKGVNHGMVADRYNLLNKYDEGYRDGFTDSDGKFYTQPELAEKIGIEDITAETMFSKEFGLDKDIERGKILEDLSQEEMLSLLRQEKGVSEFEPTSKKTDVALEEERVMPEFEDKKEAESKGYEVNARRFKSLEKAEKFKEILVQRHGPELEAEQGLGAIEIIKAGKSYRVAIKEKGLGADVEDIVSEYFVEGEGSPYGNLIDKGEAVPEATRPRLSVEEAETKLGEIMAKTFESELKEGKPVIKEGVDVEKIADEIGEVAGDLRPSHPAEAGLVDRADKMLSLLKLEGVEKAGFESRAHPVEYKANEGTRVALGEDEKGWDNPYDALEYMEENGIDGVVDRNPLNKETWAIEYGPKIIRKKIKAKGKKPAVLTDEEVEAAFGKEGPERVGYMKDFMDFLKNERGAVEVGAVGEDVRKAIKKIAEDALKLGMKPGEYAKQLDPTMTPRRINEINEMAESLFLQEDSIKKASKTTPMAKDGGTKENPNVNTRKSRKIKGVVVRYLPVFREELKTMLRAKELATRTGIGEYFRNPIRAFKEAGSGVKKLIYDPYIEAEGKVIKDLKAKDAKLNRIRKGISRKSAKRIWKYAMAQQKGGPEIMSKMNIKNIPDSLSPKELKAYESLRSEYNVLFDRLNEMRTSIGKAPIRKVEDYFTFMSAFSMLEKIGIKTNLVLDRPSVIRDRYAQFMATPFRFAKTRKKFGLAPVMTDPFVIYSRYANNAIRHIHISPIVAKVGELRRVFKLDSGDRWKLGSKKPRLDRFLLDWSNHLAQQAEFKLPTRIERGLGMISRNLTYSVLGGLARTALIQISALRNTFTELGPIHTTKGIISSLKPGSTKRILAKSSLEQRIYDAVIGDAMSALKTGKVGGAKKLLASGTMWPLKYIDLRTAMATWDGAYKMAKNKLKMGETEARTYANDVVTRTQASALPGDLAPVQRTALGKFITLFQTFVINDWNFLTEDVLGIKNAKITNKKVVEKVLKYIFATTALNILFEDLLEVKSPFPTPAKAVIEGLEDDDGVGRMAADVFMELLEPIPVVSSARYGTSPFGPGVEVIEELTRLMRDYPMQKPWYETVGKLLGIPGTTQIMKTKRARERGAGIKEQIFGSKGLPKSKKSRRSRF